MHWLSTPAALIDGLLSDIYLIFATGAKLQLTLA